jgi:hypothetical protein
MAMRLLQDTNAEHTKRRDHGNEMALTLIAK